MLLERLRAGMRTGVVAASGTTGALVGFGWRQGMPARPFNAMAAPLVGAGTDGVWGFRADTTLLGLLLHVALVIGLGVLFTLVAAPLRGARLVGAALLFTLLVHLATTPLPSAARPGLAGVLGAGETVLAYLVLSACLVVGMRLAR